MPSIELSIDQLELDVSNPRITPATDQPSTMQRIIDDQDTKLLNLAQSIVEEGLNPMDRLLVIRSEQNNDKFTVLEGNRRVLALKILKNPSLLTGLDVRPSLQTGFEGLAKSFDPAEIGSIPCFEVSSRADGTTWIDHRHTGENEGRGIVAWSGLASSRFRGRDPALQALDFVLQHGKLTDDQKAAVEERFPITTLDRLLSTPDVRSRIGLEVRDSKLQTALPADEIIKPLRRIVLDFAERKINVTRLKLKNQQVDYVSQLGKADTPDSAKAISNPRPLDEFGEADFHSIPLSRPRRTRPPRAAIERRCIVPKSSNLRVTNAKIAEIYKELRTLRLADYPHAISVLFRVFLETFVDDYLTRAGIPLTISTGGGNKDKKRNKKVVEAIDNMESKGAVRKDFDGVVRALSVKTNPIYIDLLHSYVHNRFVSPTERDLVVAWDNAQPLFERIWP